ncbi:MAG: hypothetical protein R3Y19_02520 [Rikenellaceae bacterium]
MSKIIENPKTYTGDELTQVFFRPILVNGDAKELGIRILYNLPVPTTIGLWSGKQDILVPYAKGWSGQNSSTKYSKTLDLKKVKAEMSYSASDYFSMVYERITGSADVDMTDLSGTELEQAETELFKNSISESIRATMWVGSSSRSSGFNTFDGIMLRTCSDTGTGENSIPKVTMGDMSDDGAALELLQSMYENASAYLRAMKGEGQLAFFVTSDVAQNYEESLYAGDEDSAREARINGIAELTYRGIPVIDMQVDDYLATISDLPSTYALLTDRRNLMLAVNTRDLPGSQVAMWYNPDELENRQRATFLAAADYMLPELCVISF